MVRNLYPAIKILTGFQSVVISRSVVVSILSLSLDHCGDSVCAKFKLEIELEQKARRVLLCCSACWVASSLGNVKKSTVFFLLFHGQGQRMQEN